MVAVLRVVELTLVAFYSLYKQFSQFRGQMKTVAVVRVEVVPVVTGLVHNRLTPLTVSSEATNHF